MDNQFSKDLGSYVSFALRVNPGTHFPGHYDSTGKFIEKPHRLSLEEHSSLSTAEVETLETLLNKFKIIRPYLRPNSTLDSLKIVPKDYKEPKNDSDQGVVYRKITVRANQLEIAKKVSRLVEEIYQEHQTGNQKAAKEKYDEFNKYLEKTRKELIGDFRTGREIEDSLGLYGVGLNHADNGGAVIFVIIEAFVVVPLVSNVFNERISVSERNV